MPASASSSAAVPKTSGPPCQAPPKPKAKAMPVQAPTSSTATAPSSSSTSPKGAKAKVVLQPSPKSKGSLPVKAKPREKPKTEQAAKVLPKPKTVFSVSAKIAPEEAHPLQSLEGKQWHGGGFSKYFKLPTPKVCPIPPNERGERPLGCGNYGKWSAAKAGSPHNKVRPRVLHLFSGPHARADGLGAWLNKFGWATQDVDLVNGDDLLSKNSNGVEFIVDDLCEGVYDAAFIGTPCETFSNLRSEDDGGPRPLRDLDNIMGIPGLRGHEYRQIKDANDLVHFTATVCRIMYHLDRPFIVENPRPWPNKPSLFLYPDILDLLAAPGVHAVDFDQCPFGAETQKPTRLIFFKVDLSGMSKFRCNHPMQQWTRTLFRDHEVALPFACEKLTG